MLRTTTLGLFCAIILTLSGNAQPNPKKMNVTYWTTENRPGQSNPAFTFPESKYLPNFASRKAVGICFSGGGTRSASATLGQLRALNHLELLDDIGYISAVSGGGWTSIPFTYTPYSDDLFFGKYTPPANLTWDNINESPKGSMAKAVSRSYVMFRLLGSWFTFHGDESFAQVMDKIFLKPQGLNKHKYFTYSQAYLDEVLQKNQNLTPSDFYLAREDLNRPYLIVNGTVNAFKRKSFRTTTTQHFEITPIYSGTPNHFASMFGGMYLESYGIDQKVWRKDNNHTRDIVHMKDGAKKFELSDAMAVTGSAPGKKFNRVGANFLGLPEIELWSPKFPTYRGKQPLELKITDGGNLDNLGLIPLLRRKVERIVVFINAPSPLDTTTLGRYVNNSEDIQVLFGSRYEGQDLQLFENCGHYHKLIDGLVESKRKQEPLIFEDTYHVLNQPQYGIYNDGNQSVKVMWVYMDFDHVWFDMIQDEVLKDKFNQKKFNGGRFSKHKGAFPNYNTFFTRGYGRLIKLNKRQVNLLSQYTSYTLLSNSERVKAFISGQ